MLRFTLFTRPSNLSTLSSSFCTTALRGQTRFRKDKNEVKIIGTVANDTYVLPSGTKSITVKTFDSAGKYSNHTVHVRTSNNYTAGQRVYISGMLKSSSATTDNGKLITTGVIKGMRTYTLDNTTSAVSDENQVEIHGNVASIASSEQSESLSIANNYTLTDIEEGEKQAVNFHRVFAYDLELRLFIQNHLQKSDRVILSGRINHMTYTGPENKKLYSSFIIAEKIHKLKRRSEQVGSNEEEAEN